MTSDPLVTVVISVYNKELYIAKAIESVINQTYKKLDIIIVDDGSTDNSLQIIKDYAQDDQRIRYYTQDNSGVASCRNKGITDSEGKYIVFLDGDDFFYPDYIHTALSYMEQEPWIDLLHGSWDYMDQNGKYLSSCLAKDHKDYLHSLLLNNLFAIHAVFCKMSFVRKVGLFNFYTVTDDWEYWIRCAKEGACFKCLNKCLAATRIHPANNQKNWHKRDYRYFPIINKVFEREFGLPEKYRKLEPICRLRHHFFLMEEDLNLGWRVDAQQQFERALQLLERQTIDWRSYSFIFRKLNLHQIIRLNRVQAKRHSFKQIVIVWAIRLSVFRIVDGVKRSFKPIIGKTIRTIWKIIKRSESKMRQSPHFFQFCNGHEYGLNEFTSIKSIRQHTLEYLNSMRVHKRGCFRGYRHSACGNKPVLYASLCALLVKHLYRVRDSSTDEEIEYVLNFQGNDGIFRDPVIACPQAEGMYHGWGWKHLTLHALMTLALYDMPARKEVVFHELYNSPDKFRKYLMSRDWTAQAASIGNELQNMGVMLQYSRDYQNSNLAESLMEIMYDEIDSRQDSQTGFYGDHFHTLEQLLWGAMSSYHIWLLYFYDNRPISYSKQIIDSLLSLQNLMGGYGPSWNSSACEDIDIIDPLIRFMYGTDYRREEIKKSLKRAFPAVLRNMNADGGWVFRRQSSNLIIHPQMFSGKDESDMFYTWFRTLAFAYLSEALDDIPRQFRYEWQFKRAPGHQFPFKKTDFH